MASPYSDSSIYLLGSKDLQGPVGTGHCLCVGLVWAPEVLGTCLGTRSLVRQSGAHWHAQEQQRGWKSSSGSVAAEEYLAPLVPHLVGTLRWPWDETYHTFSRSFAWSVQERATLWPLVAPGQQTPLSGLPKVSHFLTILASTVFLKP